MNFLLKGSTTWNLMIEFNICTPQTCKFQLNDEFEVLPGDNNYFIYLSDYFSFSSAYLWGKGRGLGYFECFLRTVALSNSLGAFLIDSVSF